MTCQTEEELRAALERRHEVTTLTVDEIDSTDLMAEIAECTELESLNISMSACSALIPLLPALRNLKELHFQRCELIEFPSALLELDALESLGLANEQLPSAAPRQSHDESD